MEKDIGKIKKNENTDIVIRIDDFGGKVGLTIREFVNKSETGYSGFTKSGTRIPAESFEEFKKMINSVDLGNIKAEAPEKKMPKKSEDSEEDAGIDEDSFM